MPLLNRPDRFAVHRRERGQAAIEFVIVLPVIAVVITALVWMTIAAGDRLTVESLLRDAAHAAAVSADPHRAAQQVLERVGADDMSVSVTTADGLLYVRLHSSANPATVEATVAVATAPP